MTIRPGEEWGRIVESTGLETPPTGDLAKELGLSQGDVASGVTWRELPLDVLAVLYRLGDSTTGTLREVEWIEVGRRRFGKYFVAASTSFVRGRRMFARAHPNDGRFEWLLLDSSLGTRQRANFWRRTRTETHLPHPDIRTGTAVNHTVDFGRPKTLRGASGTLVRGVVSVEVTVESDAAVAHLPVCRVEP